MAEPQVRLISGGGWKQVEVTRKWRAHACGRASFFGAPLAAFAAMWLIIGTTERTMCWSGLTLYGMLLVGLIAFSTFEKPATRMVDERLGNTNKSPDVLY